MRAGDSLGKGRAMADHRIIDITLDETTILKRNEDVEQERRIAIFDLLEGNHFKPLMAHEGSDGTPYAGPFRLHLSVEDGRLVMAIAREDGSPFHSIILALGRFRRPIREYFAICDSYYQAVRTSTPDQIETVDMARRGIHNDASVMLQERLADKVELDFDTARRLFTLICVLHIKG